MSQGSYGSTDLAGQRSACRHRQGTCGKFLSDVKKGEVFLGVSYFQAKISHTSYEVISVETCFCFFVHNN